MDFQYLQVEDMWFLMLCWLCMCFSMANAYGHCLSIVIVYHHWWLFCWRILIVEGCFLLVIAIVFAAWALLVVLACVMQVSDDDIVIVWQASWLLFTDVYVLVIENVWGTHWILRKLGMDSWLLAAVSSS
jgi:hypothetical protein